jgi:hypothetical protein
MNFSKGRKVNLTAKISEMNRAFASHLKFGMSVLEVSSGEAITYDVVAIALAKVWIAALANLTGLGACRKGLSGQGEDGSEERQLHGGVLNVGSDSLQVFMEDSSLLLNCWQCSCVECMAGCVGFI